MNKNIKIIAIAFLMSTWTLCSCFAWAPPGNFTVNFTGSDAIFRWQVPYNYSPYYDGNPNWAGDYGLEKRAIGDDEVFPFSDEGHEHEYVALKEVMLTQFDKLLPRTMTHTDELGGDPTMWRAKRFKYRVYLAWGNAPLDYMGSRYYAYALIYVNDNYDCVKTLIYYDGGVPPSDTAPVDPCSNYKCRGGFVDCDDCKGKGYIKPEYLFVNCWSCEGKGYIGAWCGIETTMECFDCHGTGKIVAEETPGQWMCYSCSGIGVRPCDSCPQPK